MTITGTPEAQWKSQYYIYDKIRQEGMTLILFFLSLHVCKYLPISFPPLSLSSGYAGDDEVRLRAEIYVPTSLIGRLVGKGGHNVRMINKEKNRSIEKLNYFFCYSGSSIATINRCND